MVRDALSIRLTASQQERYARHLLLDELGGEGQERLLAARVRVNGTGAGARWAARYLAASGVGTLVLENGAWAEECLALSPDVRIARGPLEAAIQVNVEEGGGPAQAALRGAWAAVQAIREIARQR